MTKRFFPLALLSFAFLAACGDDDSDFIARPDGAKSSSSMARNYSSTTEPYTIVDQFNPKISYGEMVDDRDGQTYRTVKIGDQTWMAENLNYRDLRKVWDYDSSSFCYNDSAIYCERYGRFYPWSTAMDSIGTWSTNGKGCGGNGCTPTYPVRGICPSGWHLPDSTEWRILINTAGGDSIAGEHLKSRSPDWETQVNYDDKKRYGGKDTYGFSALASGTYWDIRVGVACIPRLSTEIWTSTSYYSTDAYAIHLDIFNNNAWYYTPKKRSSNPVRCVKD